MDEAAKKAKQQAAQKATRLLTYNLTEEEYRALYEAQGGKCICGRTLDEYGPATCIDHNHKTGLVRGLCCWLCNRAMGLLGDDIVRLRAVLAYLERPPAVEAIGTRFGKIGRSTRKHGTKPKQGFYTRTNVPAIVPLGSVYRCLCADTNPRPRTVCPIHGQPKVQ